MGKYIGLVGSLASIFALFFIDNKEHPNINIIAFVIGISAFLLAIILEVKSYLKNKPLKFDREGNIEYMKKIIESGGRIIVFAGNLSWIDNNAIKKVLLDKKGDLYLCAKSSAPYLEEFKKAGVHVYTYGDKDFSPRTHFTIIRQGSANEKIAITSILDDHKKQKRLVYEISKNDNDFKSRWIFYAAEDLFELTKLLNDGK